MQRWQAPARRLRAHRLARSLTNVLAGVLAGQLAGSPAEWLAGSSCPAFDIITSIDANVGAVIIASSSLFLIGH